MKKWFVLSILLSLMVAGCEAKSEVVQVNENQQQVAQNQDNKQTDKQEKLTKQEALRQVISFHNSNDQVEMVHAFPADIKDGETLSKDVEIGGPIGSKAKLSQTANVVIQNGTFIVSLTQDYHMSINNTKAINRWKYELSNTGIKLIEKEEHGNAIRIIK